MSDHDPVAEARERLHRWAEDDHGLTDVQFMLDLDDLIAAVRREAIAADPEIAALGDSTWVHMPVLFAAVRRAALHDAASVAQQVAEDADDYDSTYIAASTIAAALRRLAEEGE